MNLIAALQIFLYVVHGRLMSRIVCFLKTDHEVVGLIPGMPHFKSGLAQLDNYLLKTQENSNLI